MTKLAVSKKNQGFLYSNSSEKQVYRQHKLDCLRAFGDKIDSVLSLPAGNLEFEKMIAIDDYLPKVAVIDSYEIEPKTYKKGLSKYKELKKQHQILHYKRGNIFEANFSKYNVLDLDLCGTFTIQTVFEIVSGLQQFKEGIAFITMFKDTRNSKLSDYVKYFGVNTLQEFRDKVFVKYIEDLCGVKLYAQPYEYKNKSVNPKAKQMIMYTFVKGDRFKFKEDLTWK